MCIDEKDIRYCLNEFGLTKQIRKWVLLADGPDHPVPYDVIRKILYTELVDGSKYVVKFVREPIFTTCIIESQSKLSDLFRENGIDTPFRPRKDGHYCISYKKDDIVMDVTVEEWLGEKIPHMTTKLFEEVGRLLGRTHKISKESDISIGFSVLYDEILTKDTSYARIWRGSSHDFMPVSDYEQIVKIYNQRLTTVKSIWTSLPKAAVQGDVYSCNNITLRDGHLALYDFNLAGDEVLIGDILLCWFRTIFDDRIENDINNLSQDEMWIAFIRAYQSERPLTDIEKQYFPDVYSLLGVLYFTKRLAFWVKHGRALEAEQQYGYLFELLNIENVLEV